MLPVLIFFIQCIHDDLQVQGIIQEICIGSIYEKGFNIMLFDILRVCFLESKQIFGVDGLLIGAVAFFYVSRLFTYGCV